MEDVTANGLYMNLLCCQMLLFKDSLLYTIVADTQKFVELVLFWVKVFFPLCMEFFCLYPLLNIDGIFTLEKEIECSEDRYESVGIYLRILGKHSFQSFWSFICACWLAGVHYTRCTQCWPGLDCTANFNVLTVDTLFVATPFTSKCTALQLQGKKSHLPSFPADKGSWIPHNEITSL